MKKIIKQIMSLTIAFCGVLLLAACGGGCGGDHHNMHKYRGHRNMAEPQEVVVYEASETIVAEVPMANKMKAKMYTRNGRGGTSEMGYIKFTPAGNGATMMVDVTDLRPGKDYVVKIYPCGNCDDYSCCADKCMNITLPVLSIETQGRLTQTFNIPGVNCSDLNNAKIVLMRDGGYKAAWGRIKWAK
jgi:hypothetical protein